MEDLLIALEMERERLAQGSFDSVKVIKLDWKTNAREGWISAKASFKASKAFVRAGGSPAEARQFGFEMGLAAVLQDRLDRMR
jgi:hypothetical protein